jgi:hypothetical protein
MRAAPVTAPPVAAPPTTRGPVIETISIGHMLRETMSAPYRNLVTRPTGAMVRNRIEAALDGSGSLYAYLDFSDIDLLDFSCADEVVAKLLMTDRGPPCVVLLGLREDQHEAVEHVLTHHRLAAAAVPAGANAPQLLGWATPDSHAAFDCLCEAGPEPLGVAELARRLDWDEPRASQALEYLARQRVIRFDGDCCHPLPSA